MNIDPYDPCRSYDIVPHLEAAYQGFLDARESPVFGPNTLTYMKELVCAMQKELENIEEIYRKGQRKSGKFLEIRIY